jgi:hypothetical protein
VARFWYPTTQPLARDEGFGDAEGPVMGSAGRHFDRYNALVDKGWLAVLTLTELAVWMVYNRHGSITAEAHPGPARIAKLIGHSGPNHIRAARARLVQYGLLTRINEGGGEEVAIYRVEVPGTPPPTRNSGRVQSRARSESGVSPSPKSGANPTPIPVSLDKDEGITKGQDEGKASLALPPTLDTAEFRAAWLEWEQHRREIRKPLKPTTTSKQLAELAAIGAPAAVKTIQRSITNGWTGLFPEKGSNGHSSVKPGQYAPEQRPMRRLNTPTPAA